MLVDEAVSELRLVRGLHETPLGGLQEVHDDGVNQRVERTLHLGGIVARQLDVIVELRLSGAAYYMDIKVRR